MHLLSGSIELMVRESTWKRTKAYIRRMRGNRAGKWMVLLLLLLVEKSFAGQDVNQTIEYRLPKNIIPTSYDIKLTPHLEEGNFTFAGESTVIISVLNTTSNITLHAYYDLKLNETATKLTDINTKTFKPTSHLRDNTTDFLTLTFEEPIAPGNYQLSFKFTGNISKNFVGIYKSSYINEEKGRVWLVATRFSPTKARRAFPCWDEPALKATFNISVQHFSNFTAASNMPIKNITKATDSKNWTIFETTPRMSTYLVAFVVSDFECISNANKTFNVCGNKKLLSSLKFVHEVTEKTVSLLGAYTGIPYSLPKLDHYAIPDAESSGMENWGLIIYRESTILVDNITSNVAKQLTAELLIHEVAHQWFGNLVSPSWWKYVWLKEGIPQYFQFFIGNQIFPEWDLPEKFIARSLQEQTFLHDAAISTNYLNWDPKSPAEIKSQFSFLVYNKGAVIMHMLRHIVSDEVFQNGIRIFLKNHQYGAASSDDFWQAMEQSLKHTKPNADMKIKDIMEPWVEQKGYPIVKVLRDYKAEIAILNQTSNLSNEPCNRWCISINYAVGPELTKPTLWLRPTEDNLIIDQVKKDEFLLININQTGYYRVDYDETNWKKLAVFLDSDKYQLIPPLNRAQLINDLFYMASTDRQNFTTFFELTKYLSRESDLVPWGAAQVAIKAMRRKVFNATLDENMKKYLLTLMKKVLDEIGFDERDVDSYKLKIKRGSILQFACDLGHVECNAIASKKLLAHLEKPLENPLPPNLESWILSAGATNPKAEEILIEKIENGDYKYLKYLTNPKNKTFLQNFIEKALTNSTIPKNNTRLILGHISNGSPENWDFAVDYLMKNFDHIDKYFNYTHIPSSILNDYTWRTPTLDRLTKIDKYVDENNEELAPWVKPAVIRQRIKLEWSQINAPILNEWMEKQLQKSSISN